MWYRTYQNTSTLQICSYLADMYLTENHIYETVHVMFTFYFHGNWTLPFIVHQVFWIIFQSTIFGSEQL